MLDRFHELLRDNGKSVTKQRNALFQYLQGSGPVTVAQFLRENAGVADRASLYRALELFRRIGVVEDRITRGRRLIEITDIYDSHHHHLTCNRCGQSVSVTMPDIEQALVDLCRTHGFEVTSHVIEASGLCDSCRNSAQKLDT